MSRHHYWFETSEYLFDLNCKTIARQRIEVQVETGIVLTAGAMYEV